MTRALAGSPVLLEQEANVSAATADAKQSRAWLNPRLDTLAENLGAPSSGGQTQRQDTYSITQPLEIFGKRGARITAGERNLGAAEARRRQAQVAFAADLAIAYASAEAAQARKTVAQEELARADDDLRAARAQVNAGREADLRLAQAQASVASAQASDRAAAGEVTQSLEFLSAMVGTPAPYSGVGGSLLKLPKTNAVSGNPLGEMPDVTTAQAERDALEAEAIVEQKKWIPDVGVTAGVRHYGWSNDNGYVVGLSVSMPLFDRNSNGYEAARQRVNAADARLYAAKLNAEATRRSAEAQMMAAEQRLSAALEGERAASEAYRLGRIGYDAGKTPLMELLLIRRALSDAKGLTIDAQLARVRAFAALARSDGRLAFGEQ